MIKHLLMIIYCRVILVKDARAYVFWGLLYYFLFCFVVMHKHDDCFFKLKLTGLEFFQVLIRDQALQEE